MPKTRNLTVNDAGAAEVLSATITCKKITVFEDPTASGWPRKWQYRMPGTTDTPVILAEGGSHVFEKSNGLFFKPNEVVAHLELLAAGGSTTFNVVEE